tara:strand:+ start:2274 stop:3065 length:792 start_codon:yes stop_codon:yes gene_type:complete
MSQLAFLIYLWVFMAFVMVWLWLYQNKYQDAGIADVGWSYGLAGAAIYFSWIGDGEENRRFLLTFLASIWGIRLGTYLLIDRLLRAKEEDGRYQYLRRHFGERAQRGFFWFFQGQALFVVIFAIPFWVVAWNPNPGLTIWDLIGTIAWIAANAGEWLADKQLFDFRSNPKNKGKVCQIGLWRFSRHPNYFFEWVHWWSYVALSIGSSLWWLALVGPTFMGYLLIRVTGIPYTESQALRTRGDSYQAYQKTTSPFFPWFPKESE